MIYVLGSGVPFAVIGVTCPVGATCTCSNGSKTYTKKNATGKVLFLVPQAGTWTVTITDGSSSQSETVEITTKGQVEVVAISFDLWLYNHGTMGSPELINYSKDDLVTFGKSTITISARHNYGEGGVGTAEMIDLTPYTTAYARFSATSSNSNSVQLLITNVIDEYPSESAGEVIATTNTPVEGATGSACLLALDLSSVNSEGYVVARVPPAGATATLTELYLV